MPLAARKPKLVFPYSSPALTVQRAGLWLTALPQAMTTNIPAPSILDVTVVVVIVIVIVIVTVFIILVIVIVVIIIIIAVVALSFPDLLETTETGSQWIGS